VLPSRNLCPQCGRQKISSITENKYAFVITRVGKIDYNIQKNVYKGL